MRFNRYKAGDDLQEETSAQRKRLPELSIPSLSDGSCAIKYTKKNNPLAPHNSRYNTTLAVRFQSTKSN